MTEFERIKAMDVVSLAIYLNKLQTQAIDDYVDKKLFPKDYFENVAMLEDEAKTHLESGVRTKIAKQVCECCGAEFVIRYYETGTYEYLTPTCNCESPFSPADGQPSLSQWLEELAKK